MKSAAPITTATPPIAATIGTRLFWLSSATGGAVKVALVGVNVTGGVGGSVDGSVGASVGEKHAQIKSTPANASLVSRMTCITPLVVAVLVHSLVLDVSTFVQSKSSSPANLRPRTGTKSGLKKENKEIR